MSNALVAAERWLYSTLLADSTLAGLVGGRIYSEIVPPGTTYPVIFYTSPGAGDNRNTIDSRVIWEELIYAVRVIDKVESYLPLESGATAIEAALSHASGINISGDIMASVYQSPFRLMSVDRDGFQIRELGGIFRLYVR